MKYCYLVIFSLLTIRVNAQINLVVNPGFETVSSIPLQDGELFKAIGWISPNILPSNLYSTLALQPYVSAPLGNLGYFYQFPRSGNNFAGILTFRIDFDPNYRQYVQGKLSDTLERKKKYKVEYFTNLCNGCVYSTNNLGVYFSNDSFIANSAYSLLDTPQVINSSTNALNDTLNWIKISGTYVAKGGEKHFTIGIFSAALGLDTIKISNTPPCTTCQQAYYNIDDVSVTLWDSTISVNELNERNKIKVFPNPAQNQFTISTPSPNTDMVFELYDVLGYLQRKQKLLNTATNFSTAQLRNSVYFYKIVSADTIIQQGKLVISK